MTDPRVPNSFSTQNQQVTGGHPLYHSGDKPLNKPLPSTEKTIKTANRKILSSNRRSAFRPIPRSRSRQNLGDGGNRMSTSFPPKTNQITQVYNRKRGNAFGEKDLHHTRRDNRSKTVSYGVSPLIGNACMSTVTNTPSPEPSLLLTDFLKRTDERLRLEWPRLSQDYGDLFSDEGLSVWYRNVNPDITKAIELLMEKQEQTDFRRTPWQSIDQVNAVQLYLVSLGPQLAEKEIEIPVILTPEDIELALKTLIENDLLRVNKSDDSNKEFINGFLKLFQQESNLNLNLNWLNSDFVKDSKMGKDKLLVDVRTVFIDTCDSLLGASAQAVRDLAMNVDYHLWPAIFRHVWGTVRHQNECIFQNFLGFIINKKMSMSEETGKVTDKIRDAATKYKTFFNTAYHGRWTEWNMNSDYFYTICHIVVPRPSDDSSSEDYDFYPLKFDEVLDNLAKHSKSITNVSDQTSGSETKPNITDQKNTFEKASQETIAQWIKDKSENSLIKTQDLQTYKLFDNEFTDERYFQDYNGHLEKQIYWLVINATYINLKNKYQHEYKVHESKYKKLVNGFVMLFDNPFKLKEDRVKEGLSSIRGWDDYLSSGGFTYILDLIAELDSQVKENEITFCVEYYMLNYMKDWFSRFKPMIAAFQREKRPVELMKVIGIAECEITAKFVDLICEQLEKVEEPTSWTKKIKKLSRQQRKQPEIIKSQLESKLQYGGPQASDQPLLNRYNKTAKQIVSLNEHIADSLRKGTPKEQRRIQKKRSKRELRSTSLPTPKITFKNTSGEKGQLKKKRSFRKRKSQTPPPK